MTTRDWGSGVSMAVSALVFTPAFLASCVVVAIGRDFAFGTLELGFALGLFYTGGTIASTIASRWIDRIGARAGLLIACALTAISLLGCAAATSSGALVLMIGVAGLGAGVGGPAAVRLLVTGNQRAGRALRFSLRQSAAPIAAVLTGLFAATLTGWIGWRASYVAFVGVAVACAAFTAVCGREGVATAPTKSNGNLAPHTVALLIAGAFLLGAAVSAYSGFLVPAGVRLGMAPEAASLLLSASSLVAIAARLAVGHAADKRTGGHLLRAAALLFIGGVCSAIAAMSTSLVVFIGAVLATSATAWSSNSLYTFAIVNNQAHSPGKASGTIQIGAFAGSAAGPIAFGWITTHVSELLAWLFVAVCLILASLTVVIARHTFATGSAASR